MAPAEHRTAVPRAWTFTRTVDGWVLAPFRRPWPVSTLVRWVLRHGAHETFGRAQEQLRQTVSSALRSPVSVGTRVTVSLESSGLLMVESLDPALLPYPSRLANGHVLRQDANDGHHVGTTFVPVALRANG